MINPMNSPKMNNAVVTEMPARGRGSWGRG